jgi:hypothetical protein
MHYNSIFAINQQMHRIVLNILLWIYDRCVHFFGLILPTKKS